MSINKLRKTDRNKECEWACVVISESDGTQVFFFEDSQQATAEAESALKFDDEHIDAYVVKVVNQGSVRAKK